MTIGKFHGQYNWLSNFYLSVLQMQDGITYPTVEHAFQAHKTKDLKKRKMIARLATAGVAKKTGRQVKLREDWETVKFNVMEQAVRQKFLDPTLRKKLVATHPHHLVEGNTWGDKVWGVCEGKGENHLGRILMKVREEMLNE